MLEAKLRLPLLLLLCESKIVASIFVRVAVFFSTTFPVKTATNQKYWKNVMQIYGFECPRDENLTKT